MRKQQVIPAALALLVAACVVAADAKQPADAQALQAELRKVVVTDLDGRAVGAVGHEQVASDGLL